MMLLGRVEGIISQTLHPSHIDADIPCIGVVPEVLFDCAAPRVRHGKVEKASSTAQMQGLHSADSSVPQTCSAIQAKQGIRYLILHYLLYLDIER